MEKLYTNKEYEIKAVEANQTGKQLYIHTYSVEYEESVLDFTEIEIEKQEPVYDENGDLQTDSEGNPAFETVIETVQKPVMIEKTETDEEGNEYTVQIQSSHTEIKTKEVAELLIAPVNYYVCYRDNLTNGTVTEDFEEKELSKAKEQKHVENTAKAKRAVENGYVTFKNAQFETNTQTVGDLTATMLMLQNERAEAEGLAMSKTETPFIASEVNLTAEVSQNEEDSSVASLPQNDISYTWLSKDDKAIELTLEDFSTLGNLIAAYKNTIWSEKYIAFKTAIENAQTLEDLEGIDINYDNSDV